MRWNSGSFGHDFTYVRIHSPVRMCGSLRDVRKKACFLVRDKTLCAQIYCKNDVADYKKEIHGYKKWELFSILFIIPYLCRVFHADTSVREVWESGKYIYIEKTFTWRFVLGTLKLRKFLTLPQTKGVGFCVARSDRVGNAKASKCRMNNRYRFPRFFFIYVSQFLI